jgi:secretion/DNA translocation related CpaE-like protein
LVITEDAELLDELLRLTAVAGLEPEVAAGPVRAQWRAAPLILIGADRLAAALDLPRRLGVIVVARSADLKLYASGVRLGVTDVIELPAGERRLVEWLASARADPAEPPGVVWSLLSGCGGAGASVLAAALAVGAASSGEVLLVDADPLSGGIDLLLGAERAGGLRWPDLAIGAAPVPVAALRDALPHAHGVSILAAARPPDPPTELSAAALATVLHAGRRLARLTIVDLSRTLGPATEAALGESNRGLLVVPDEVRAVAAAARMAAWARDRCANLAVVVRQRAGDLAATAVAGTLALPLAGEIPEEPGLPGDLERGEAPGRRSRSPLGRLTARLLAAGAIGEPPADRPLARVAGRSAA